MGKPNTRQFDRTIEAAGRKLAGIRARQTWALTPGEQAKLAACGAVVIAKATRMKASSSSERGMATIWANAEARYAAEIRAAEAAKQKVLEDAAAARVARKSKGWF